jgi:hypothetical protein
VHEKFLKKLAKKIKIRYIPVLVLYNLIQRVVKSGIRLLNLNKSIIHREKGMSDLFEKNEDAVEGAGEDFIDLESDLDVETEIMEVIPNSLDARRRLENILDEKRLRDELDDFGDY